MKFSHLMITGAALLSFSAIAADEAKKDTEAQGSQLPAASQDQKQPGSAAATGAGTAPGSTGTQSGAVPTDKASGSAAAGASASDKSAAPTKGPEASGSSGTQSGPNPAASSPSSSSASGGTSSSGSTSLPSVSSPERAAEPKPGGADQPSGSQSTEKK